MSHPDPLRILVVDDEPLIINNLLQGALELEGYTVSSANDGTSGLIAIRSTPAPTSSMGSGETTSLATTTAWMSTSATCAKKSRSPTYLN